MTTPLPPGWYPDPDGKPEKLYWDGQQWFSASSPPEVPVPGWFPDPSNPSRQRYFDGNEWTENYALLDATPAKPDTSTGKKTKFRFDPTAVLITLGIIVALPLVIAFASFIGIFDDTDKSSTATTTRSAAPDPWEYMAGNGTYEIGNEKYWGIWEATAPRQCTWSIREVSRYSGATILDEGSATPGQRIRVNIQPPPGGGRTVAFMTNGCGPWKLVE